MSAPPALQPLMRVLCAWCLKKGITTELPPKPVQEPTDKISHGICPACAEGMRAQIKPLKRRASA